MIHEPRNRVFELTENKNGVWSIGKEKEKEKLKLKTNSFSSFLESALTAVILYFLFKWLLSI